MEVVFAVVGVWLIVLAVADRLWARHIRPVEAEVAYESDWLWPPIPADDERRTG